LLAALALATLLMTLFWLPRGPEVAAQAGKPLHPTFPLLDTNGDNVLTSGQPISTMQSCGACHDTAYIAAHSSHATAGPAPSGRAWDGSADRIAPWSGTTRAGELNCLLCHTARPNNDARLVALASADSAWAGSATLLGTGLIEQVGGQWRWNSAAFTAAGEVEPAALGLQPPADANCGLCHGIVASDVETPVTLNDGWQTATTGLIVSPQRLLDSGLNLVGKASLTRSWDAHAERLVACADCHYPQNSPAFDSAATTNQPEHLLLDPRTPELGDFLQRPSHILANSAEANPVGCAACHNDAGHEWLPYTERHTAVLSCEACHVPRLYAPAYQSVDWTALQADGTPLTGQRGRRAAGGQIEGYEPTLLARRGDDLGASELAPYNLIAVWYWVYGPSATPVAERDITAAWLDGEGGYRAEALVAFDANGDGALEPAELVIDSEAKERAITSQLEALGLENPRIAGEVRPYAISHGVAGDEWATKECRVCHGAESRITQPLPLADTLPGGVMPTLLSGDGVTPRGKLVYDEAGLYYQPESQAGPDSPLASLYILGHSAAGWVDLLGAILFVATVAATTTHGGLRYLAARREAGRGATPAGQPAAMYGVYERLWHWLQTAVIFGLLFTGLVIHKPDIFGLFSFRSVVLTHNVLAGILLLNAALAAFYHLASGEIRHFLPRPYGFFDQAVGQAVYYLRGIFRGAPHPFVKTPRRKMNPLQQLTYLGLLNILLPLQIITGALMWGLQQWPEAAARLGGLPGLAPFHTLIAWLFASFIVAHVYLTTTVGHSATDGVRAMIVGWERVEDHPEPGEALS
jgi:thiosulfate reductase cytochrome b subunit